MDAEDKFNDDITLDDLDIDFSFDSASFNYPTAESLSRIEELSTDNGQKIIQLQDQINYLEELIKMIFQKIVYPNHMPNKRKKQN